MRRVNAFVAISPKSEGGNIYMPHGDFAIFTSVEEAKICGWDEKSLVPCEITYNQRSDQ